MKISFDYKTFFFWKIRLHFELFRLVRSSQRAVYAEFCGSKHGFHFLLPAHAIGIPSGKENETKEKGASNKAHFPLETRYPSPIDRLRTGLKWAALFLDVSPPYAT